MTLFTGLNPQPSSATRPAHSWRRHDDNTRVAHVPAANGGAPFTLRVSRPHGDAPWRISAGTHGHRATVHWYSPDTFKDFDAARAACEALYAARESVLRWVQPRNKDVEGAMWVQYAYDCQGAICAVLTGACGSPEVTLLCGWDTSRFSSAHEARVAAHRAVLG